MNQLKIYFSILCCVFTFSSNYAQQVEQLNDALNHLQNIRDFSIAQDQSEIYFTVQSPSQNISQIVCIKNMDWDHPILLPFCDQYSYLEPFLSHQDNRLYFSSNRPKNDTSNTASDFDIWYVERNNKEDNWSAPINIGAPVNTTHNEFYPSLSAQHNLYFTMDAPSGMGNDDIYFSEWLGNQYAPPVLLNENINSDGYEFNAFINSEENLLIYTKYNASGGLGSGDLYFSQKDENGNWQAAKHISSPINTKWMEYCPFYDENTQTLYFTSRRQNLPSIKFENFNELKKYISGAENGLSKIYKVKIQF